MTVARLFIVVTAACCAVTVSACVPLFCSSSWGHLQNQGVVTFDEAPQMFYITGPNNRVLSFNLEPRSAMPRTVDPREGDNSPHRTCNGDHIELVYNGFRIQHSDMRYSPLIEVVDRRQCGDEPHAVGDAFFSLGCGFVIFERRNDLENEIWIADVKTRRVQRLTEGRLLHQVVAGHGARRTFAVASSAR